MKEKLYGRNQEHIFDINVKKLNIQEKASIVSIIVPIYKVENYLQQCINSICSQTYQYIEIILIDDGSPDLCGKICDRNAIKDPRIQVIHKKNGGVSSARNAGLDIAKGEYISFIDADDTVHPEFIETLLGLCKLRDCDIAQCEYLSVAEDSIKLPLNPQQTIKFYNNRQAVHELTSGSNGVKYSVVWNKLYRKRLFDDIRYPLSRIHEDESTIHLLLWKARKIAVTNQYLYYYLRHASSIMGRPFSVERMDVLDALKERLVFLDQNGLKNEYMDTLKTTLYLIDKYLMLLRENIPDCENLCNKLLSKKEEIIKEFPGIIKKQSIPALSYDQMKKICSYPSDSRIVLYGAGNRGQLYRQWIDKTHHGNLIGWVDNRWYAFEDMAYPVSPIDALLKMEFDYILITIENKAVQEEICENLISWGIPGEKILF